MYLNKCQCLLLQLNINSPQKKHYRSKIDRQYTFPNGINRQYRDETEPLCPRRDRIRERLAKERSLWQSDSGPHRMGTRQRREFSCHCVIVSSEPNILKRVAIQTTQNIIFNNQGLVHFLNQNQSLKTLFLQMSINQFLSSITSHLLQ